MCHMLLNAVKMFLRHRRRVCKNKGILFVATGVMGSHVDGCVKWGGVGERVVRVGVRGLGWVCGRTNGKG